MVRVVWIALFCLMLVASSGLCAERDYKHAYGSIIYVLDERGAKVDADKVYEESTSKPAKVRVLGSVLGVEDVSEAMSDIDFTAKAVVAQSYSAGVSDLKATSATIEKAVVGSLSVSVKETVAGSMDVISVAVASELERSGEQVGVQGVVKRVATERTFLTPTIDGYTIKGRFGADGVLIYKDNSGESITANDGDVFGDCVVSYPKFKCTVVEEK